MSRWTSWFFVAACGSSPAPRPTPPAAAPPPPSLAAIASTWGGMGYQPDAGVPIEIHLTISDAAVGARIGTIDYPRAPCSGDLIRIEAPATELRVRERLSNNPDGVCIDGGTIILPLTPMDDTLEFKWLFPDGKVGVTATLAR